MKIDVDKIFWRVASLLTVPAAAAILDSLLTGAEERAWFSISLKMRLLAGAEIALLVACVAWAVLTWLRPWERLLPRLERAAASLRRLGPLNLLPALAFIGVIMLVVFAPHRELLVLEQTVQGVWARLGLIYLCSLAAALFVKAAFPALRPIEAVLGALFASGVIYRALIFTAELSASPFSVGWSEGSRFYFSSLFYSQRLYGQDLAWPFLHPSRYLMLSLPHLIPSLPLAFHRFWQVSLWLGMTGLAAYLLARRLKPARPALGWLFGAWAFLFLFQGPVYYHLLVMVCIIFAGFDSKRFGKSLVVILLASLWAGISRVNWFPVPAMLGITIYLLETPYTGKWWRYFRQPLIWGVAGMGAAAVAQAVYAVISKQPDVSAFGSSFTSDLLWYRLMPSPTYPPGILPMIVLLTLPALALVALNLRKVHFWRAVALAGMTLVLFAGGVVVSTKIGGGSNLHNMDAYLTVLLTWAALVWGGLAVDDQSVAQKRLPLALVLLLAVLPFYPLVMSGAPVRYHDLAAEQAELQTLRNIAEPAAQAGQRVLFMWNRQLLTFGEFQGVPLEADYETVELMEMAMSRNTVYLEQFTKDLQAHKFGIIISSVQNTSYKDAEAGFPEEHNAWTDAVAIPVMTYYCELDSLPLSGIQILLPNVPGAPCSN